MGKYIPIWDSYIPGMRFPEGENAGMIDEARVRSTITTIQEKSRDYFESTEHLIPFFFKFCTLKLLFKFQRIHDFCKTFK